MPQQGDQPVKETNDAPASPAAAAESQATSRFQEEATDSMASNSDSTGLDSSSSSTLADTQDSDDSKTDTVKELDSKELAAENVRGEITPEDYAELTRRIQEQKGDKPEVKDGKVDCPDCQKAAAPKDDPQRGVPSDVPEQADVNADQNIGNGQYEIDGRRVAAIGSQAEVREASGQESAEARNEGNERNRDTGDGSDDRAIPRIKEVSPAGDKAPPGSADRIRDGGDGNVVREYDESTDSEAEVKRKFSEMARENHGPNADGMIESFNKSYETMSENLSPEQMQEVRRNMSVMMSNDNMSERLTANTVVDHAAKVADAVDGHGEANAFAQGPNPTCNLTSQARLEAQNDAVKYSNKAASVVSRGGAWTGGENGTAASWTQIDQSNFRPDAEANESYNATEKQYGGERGMAGKLDDALRGQQMADNSTLSRREAGTLGDNQSLLYTTGGGRGHDLAKQGTYMHTEGANGAADTNTHMFSSADSTLENVAQSNYQEGLGGLLVSESYRGKPGTANLEKYGARFFSGVDGLKAEAGKNPGQELQIATNGSMILGQPGHGLHAQTVRSEVGSGDLVFGNNWTASHNNKKYNDAFVDTFTDPAKSSHRGRPSDGGGRGDGGSFDNQDWGNKRMDDRDYINQYKDEQQKEEERQAEKAKEKEEEEEEKGDKDPEEKAKEDGKDTEAQGRFSAEHSRWMQRREAAEAVGQSFTEREPVISDFLGK